VLHLAQEEAQRFQHYSLGTEHLLLALVREEEGGAAQVLRNLGVELKRVRSAVAFIRSRGERILLDEIGLARSEAFPAHHAKLVRVCCGLLSSESVASATGS